MNEEPVGAPRAVVADLLLERHRLGELAPADAMRVDRLVAGDSSLANRVMALDQSDRDIERDFPASDLARAVAARLGASVPKERPAAIVFLTRWGVPLAVAAAGLLVVLRPDAWLSPPAAPPVAATTIDGDRPKGTAATLMVYRSVDAGSELLTDNTVAHTGDVIRLGYRSAQPAYGAIVSLDGNGVVTLHLPADGARAVALESGKTVLLDRAFELDDAPRLERFYFITASRSFEMTPVVDAVRRAATSGGDPTPLLLPTDLNHSTFSLRKDSRP